MPVIFEKIDWVSIGAFFGVVGSISLIGWWMIAQVLRGKFVTHEDHKMLGRRLEGVENSLHGMATKADLREMAVRLAPLEKSVSDLSTGVAVLNSEVRATREGVTRTEHLLSMLYDHALNGEKKP